MANVTDLANAAAAVSAGYAQVETDHGASANPRYRAAFIAPVGGSATDDQHLLRADGVDNALAATALANALASLNAQRRHTFGGSPGRASASSESTNGRGGTRVIR